MHERTNIRLSAADRSELEQKHVWRAKIVLLTADGHGTADIMRATGKAKTVIWRWQERFGEEGVTKLRPARIPPLRPEVAEGVVALTLAGPPPTASHWTGAAMAKAAGISVSSVQRIWRAHGLRPRPNIAIRLPRARRNRSVVPNCVRMARLRSRLHYPSTLKRPLKVLHPVNPSSAFALQFAPTSCVATAISERTLCRHLTDDCAARYACKHCANRRIVVR